MNHDEGLEIFIKIEKLKQQLIEQYKENPESFSLKTANKLFVLKNIKQFLKRRNLYDLTIELYKLETVNDCFQAIQSLECFRKILLTLDSSQLAEV